jgi:hypothetical protein
MCLVTNEGRAPARTARPPLRLPRPPAARCQVAGEGAAARGAGRGWRGRPGRAARGPPACGRASAAEALTVGISVPPFPSQARKDGEKEGRKEAKKEGTASMEGSGGGALALRVHRPQSGSGRRRLDPGAWRRVGAVCMPVCASGRGRGRDMCVWAVHCGELGLRLYVCSLKWVERWPVPGMFHDVLQPQEGG